MNEEHNYGRGGKVKRNTGRAWPGGGGEWEGKNDADARTAAATTAPR